MPSIHLRACSFAHTAATVVLDDVTLDLADGWVGVVGSNGSGKTTLLRLLTGDLVPTSGQVHVVADVPPVLCPQAVDDLDPSIRVFSWDWTGLAARIRSRLDLDPDDLDRWDTLSPGERKRWQVGAALAAEPDVLLLDEPTNHLDAAARDLLVDALRGFDGLGLVVSHDRALLDGLTTETVRLVRGRADVHAGGYSDARERWVAEEAALRDAHVRARREERRLRRVLGEVRRERQGAERAPRAARRTHPRDADVREAGRKFAQQKAEKKLANRVGQLNARVARAHAVVEAIDVPGDVGGDLRLDVEGAGRRWVARLQGDVAHAGGGTLLRDLDLAVARGDRIHVAGVNGAGKTTLLRALRACAVGEIGWLPQELTPAAADECLARVRGLDPDRRGRVLGIVANLGVDPDRVMVTDAPSPGEARKLALALLLLDPVDLVIMDEPTNHLDLPSIERLEATVADYRGAMVLATHDLAFAGATTATLWQVEDATVRVSTQDGR